MATKLIEFPLESGGSVLVEVTVPQDRGGLVGRSDDTVEAAPHSFENALATLKPVCEAVMARMSALAIAPEEVEIELGVALKAEAGFVIARTAAEGNLRVKVKWKPNERP